MAKHAKCDLQTLARKMREARRMPIASIMRPLRNHLLRLAASDAKHGYCQRAGQMVAKARKLADENPHDIAYQRAVRRAKGL